MLPLRDPTGKKKNKKALFAADGGGFRLKVIRKGSRMEESWSGDDGRNDGDFVAPPALFSLSQSQRAALTRETVDATIQRYVNPNWSARSGQYEVVQALWRGEDVVCTFPTSAGKTLIMMLPALLSCHLGVGGVWVVCQPLEALRKTTVAKIKTEFFSKTDAVVAVWSSATPELFEDILDLQEAVGVLFCSPEQLLDVYRFLHPCSSRVAGLLVDEAHLRFAWKFRDFRATDRFSTRFPSAVIGLFSATLSPAEAGTLARLMGIREVTHFTEQEFPELRQMKLQRWDQFVFRCISMSTGQVVAAILDLYSRLRADQSVIVFAASYSKLAKLAEPFGRRELQCFMPRLYCSTYSAEHKETTCKLLNSGRCRLVGATCALGAGVDLVNVGAVMFYGCPKTFSDATQGMGRAGRGPGRPPVDVVFAADSASASKADNCMRLLMGYCSKSLSVKKISCSLCQERRALPGVEGAAAVYKTCFDFEGVHCLRPGRPACMLVICKVFDGLLTYDDLANADLDCGSCGSCAPLTIVFPVLSLVSYKNRDAVVYDYTPNRRCKIRMVESLTSHTVAPSSLALVSALPQPLPPAVETKKISKIEKAHLVAVLEERFCAASAGMLLLSVPSKVELKRLARWSAEDSSKHCRIRILNVDMRVWFEEAQREAKQRAEAETQHGVCSDDGSDCISDVEEVLGCAAEEGELHQRGEGAVESVADTPFELSAGILEYMRLNLGPLRAAVAEQAAIANGHLLRRRRLRDEEVDDGEEKGPISQRKNVRQNEKADAVEAVAERRRTIG